MNLSPRLLPCMLLLAEVLVFHRRVLFGDGYVIPWDLRYFHLPHAEFIADSFRRGEMPLWDPFTMFGRPFFANIQTQIFYPPRVLSIAFSNLWGGDNLLYFLEWELALHVWLAGVFAYSLLRRLGTATPAALVGATVFQLGGFFASQAQHIGVIGAGTWLALAWLCVVALRESPSRRWTALLALAFCMSVLSGLPALTVTVYASTFLLACAWSRGGERIRVPATTVAAGVLGLLLAAVQLGPTIQLNFHSIAQYRTEWLGSGGGLPLQSLVSLVAPGYYDIFDLKRFSGRWELTFLYLYCGLGGLALALAAAARRDGESTRWALLTLLFGVAMLGDSTPPGRYLYATLPPIIRTGLHPEFTMPAFTLGVAVLAGLGAAWLLRRPVLAWGALAIVAADLTLVGSGRPMNTASLRDEPGVTRRAFDGSAPALDRVRLLVNQTKPPARVDTINGSMNWAMAAPLTRVPSANGNDPMLLARPIQVRLGFCEGERWGAYYQVSKLDSPVLDLVNVRYLLSRTPVEHPSLAYVADAAGHLVYENREVLPRFFLVNRLREARDLEEAVRLLHAPEFRPAEEAIVEAATASSSAPQRGSVIVERYAANLVELVVDTPGAAFLVTSEAHYPGWRVYVDGREQPIVLTNVAFRGAAVPPGKHSVVFRFAPAISWWSALVSAVAWLGWLWLIAAKRLRL